MASCTTAYWNSNESTPRVRLTVTNTSDGHTSATLTWKLEYIAPYAVSTSVGHMCTAVVNGTTVYSGNYSIGGKKGTHTIDSGTISVSKGTSSKSVSFSCSMDFTGITWSGSISGKEMGAGGTITISAKTSYTVSYNANGGSGAPSSQTKWYGTALTLSSTKPSRTGYTFKGWGRSSSTTTVAYNPGDSYTANASVTLYAIWTAKTYTVSYNANGGSGAPSSQTKTHGVTLTLSSTKPTCTNYAFQGWGTSASTSTVSYKSGASYTSNAAITLYAVWKRTYEKPTITNLKVKRCNSSGTASDSGTYASVSFDYTSSVGASSIKIECLKSGSVVTQTNMATDKIKVGSVTNKVVGSGSLSAESAYTIRVTITDDGGSTSEFKTLTGTVYSLDFLSGGNGAAFGKAAESDGFLELAWHQRFLNNKHIYGIDDAGRRIIGLTPVNSNGNTLVGYGQYSAEDDSGNPNGGNTHLYGYDLQFFVRNVKSSGGTSYKPYISRGDTLSFSFRSAGFTAGATAVYFFIPFTKPVIGSPTITCASTNGFKLRQNGKYTHGSSSSAYASATKIEATLLPDIGIYVGATFSDSTNATAHTATGVVWEGTLTFT